MPSAGSEEIELYQRTYYSLLRSSAEVRIRTLEEVHAGTNSVLHPKAREFVPDMSAFIYSFLRLPSCMPDVRLVILGQSADVFARGGYLNLNTWQEVFAAARRRRCLFDGQETLACFIASRSDIDDIIPGLTAYQIEWNKLHYRLKRVIQPTDQQSAGTEAGSPFSLRDKAGNYSELAEILELPQEDIERLSTLWGEDFADYLEKIAARPCDLRVKLLSGSLVAYRRATHAWWESIEHAVPKIKDRPVYFVSSNPHSAINVLSGFAFQRQDELVHFLERPGNTRLLSEWNDIQNQRVPSSWENFLYYVLKKYQQDPEGHKLIREQQTHERELGMVRAPGTRASENLLHYDVEAQIIELSRLKPDLLDPRLQDKNLGDWLADSDALILNIDYPLGLAAYDILTEAATQSGSVLGVYIMGKAATLNAVAGDVMISGVVHDEHTRNTYLFSNCFSAADIAPNLVYGTVLDNQKAMTVKGTFLQNVHYMDVFYREGFTAIEMEAGPYLSAVYEMHRPKRHPIDEIVDMHNLPFDLGIIHYASDTPLSKGKNLGAGSMSYFGMDSTYAATLAVLRRIFRQEQARLQSQRKPCG